MLYPKLASDVAYCMNNCRELIGGYNNLVIYRKEIESIAAGQQHLESGALKFTMPDLPPNTVTQLEFGLEIGDLDKPDATLKPI